MNKKRKLENSEFFVQNKVGGAALPQRASEFFVQNKVGGAALPQRAEGNILAHTANSLYMYIDTRRLSCPVASLSAARNGIAQ